MIIIDVNIDIIIIIIDVIIIDVIITATSAPYLLGSGHARPCAKKFLCIILCNSHYHIIRQILVWGSERLSNLAKVSQQIRAGIDIRARVVQFHRLLPLYSSGSWCRADYSGISRGTVWKVRFLVPHPQKFWLHRFGVGPRNLVFPVCVYLFLF